MKKLLTLTALIMCTASIQAATVNWGWTFHAEDADVNMLSGTIQIMGLTGAVALNGGGDATGTSNFSDGTTTYTVRFTTTINASGYYVESTFNTPSAWSGVGPTDASTMSSLWDATITSMQAHTGGGPGIFDVSTYANPSNWTPVPEPTSMALFGIGAAVLGLRRKFRKA